MANIDAPIAQPRAVPSRFAEADHVLLDAREPMFREAVEESLSAAELEFADHVRHAQYRQRGTTSARARR